MNISGLDQRGVITAALNTAMERFCFTPPDLIDMDAFQDSIANVLCPGQHRNDYAHQYLITSHIVNSHIHVHITWFEDLS